MRTGTFIVAWILMIIALIIIVGAMEGLPRIGCAILWAVIAVVMVLHMRNVQKDDRFQVVERFPGGCVWVDTETGIGYGEMYDSGEVFPMYNADGTPYRPNGWRDAE